MSVRTLFLGWLLFSATLFSFLLLVVAVGEASVRLARWTEPPDPERLALDELERIWERS